MKKIDDINKYISSKMRTECILRWFLIIWTILWGIATVVLISDYTNERMAAAIALFLPSMIGGIICFGHYFPCYRSTKWINTDSADIRK